MSVCGRNQTANPISHISILFDW